MQPDQANRRSSSETLLILRRFIARGYSRRCHRSILRPSSSSSSSLRLPPRHPFRCLQRCDGVELKLAGCLHPAAHDGHYRHSALSLLVCSSPIRLYHLSSSSAETILLPPTILQLRSTLGPAAVGASIRSCWCLGPPICYSAPPLVVSGL
ncbi:hypothetical protein PIB30_043162 [Stylosanthes scabra]|uniref:Uncharacterized protein n=1 Tax=Stylosanthes scabra TaxID=79078 RepID=A0ABU6RFN4_9FABA|nr:hypothetical protein [Stylosanthes scabra]